MSVDIELRHNLHPCMAKDSMIYDMFKTILKLTLFAKNNLARVKPHANSLSQEGRPFASGVSRTRPFANSVSFYKICNIQGVRAKFDSRRVFRKKQYISAKKADIFENQTVLIISAPRRQIATTVVPLASTKTCWRFLELVKITMALPLLKTSV